MTSSNAPPPYQDLLKSSLQDAAAFLRLTCSQSASPDAAPWQKISIRPVQIKGRRHLQFSHFDGRKDITRNLAEPEALAYLDEILAMRSCRSMRN